MAKQKPKGWLDKFDDNNIVQSDATRTKNTKNIGIKKGYDQPIGNMLDITLNAPQRQAVRMITGEEQSPSEAMDITNPYGAFAADAILDPTNLVGAGLLGEAAKASTKTGVLSKAYKINPWAFEPNPRSAYRMIGGKEGYLDAINSGEIRAMQNGVYGDAHFNMGVPLNPNRLSPEELLKAGSPGGYKGPYMVERKWADTGWNKNTMTDGFKNNPELLQELKNLGKDKDVWGKYGNLKTNDDAVKLYKEHWLQGYKEVPKKENGGWLEKYNDGGPIQPNYNDSSASAGPDFEGDGTFNKGRDYSPAWGGQFQMGGSMPGAVGFMYARTNDPAPSNGKYAKKTKASAQNGKEMQFYQEGLDFRPKSISKKGSVIKDDRGQWDHPGEITEIGSNQITMQDVPYPVMGVSDTGDTQMMYPNQEYQYNGNSVTEYPMMQDGGILDPLINLGKRAVNYIGGLFDNDEPVAKAAPVKPKLDAYETMLDLGYNSPQGKKLEKQLGIGSTEASEYQKDKNRIKLTTGRFANANVSSRLIDDIAEAAKRSGVPVKDLLTLVARESTFGEDKLGHRGHLAKDEFTSGWNVAEDYKPYDPHRFLADRKVPGINVLKDSGGYIYEVADEKAAREYLKKNPQIIEQYRQKIAATPDIGNKNFFDLSAEFLKKKGIKGYNPGDPNYEKMFKQDYATLKKDKALMNYLKKKNYPFENGGQLKKLDQLTNFTNYNPTQPSGWLEKYQ
jgi:hypothetical protein